ncbi:MAG: precorrin-4 C(11)-methyltransferase [Butyrivibrio sp.]|nr:precorrin-4 C(11)-methyltransferase [Butyrivibrio sp.]
MIHFVGAGSGAVDLITVRGKKLVDSADVVIYAGSLVNPEILSSCKKECRIYDSAKMTLEEVIEVMVEAEKEEKSVVRLHTGDPCLYGAIREQMDILDDKEISYDYCPGVSSFCGAASALKTEYTLPDVSQSVVITRMEGRTPVPELEKIEEWAKHQSTMVIFLSMGLLKQLEEKLMQGGYSKDTPAAIVYKATWPEEKVFPCTVSTIYETARKNQITKTALIVVGKVLNSSYERSKLYDPGFTTEFRKGTDGYIYK